MSKNAFTPDGAPHRTSRVLNVSDGLKRIGEFEAAEMLAGYAAILRERESPKAAVTDEMINAAAYALAEYDGADPSQLIWEGNPPEPWGEIWNRYEGNARAALEAVAPMLASARVPDGWRTMESAPKDGTSVLLAFRERSGKYNIQGGRWNADDFSKRIRPYWCGDKTYLGTTYFRACQPTHWQPLAEAPKPEKE